VKGADKVEEVLNTISFLLRVAEPLFALIIVILCFSSLKGGRRDEHALVVLDNDQEKVSYPVLYWENSIGRSRSSDIEINDPEVSRDHAVLLRRKDGWFITDTGSKTGVFVNGEQTEGRCPLAVGDIITIGDTKLVLRRSIPTQNNAKSVKEHKRVPGAVILGLITLYILMLLFQAVINMGSFFALIPAMGFVAAMFIFYAVSYNVFKRRDFELESLALLLSGTGIMLAASHNTDTRQAYVQLAAVILGMIIYSFMIWFIEVPDRVMKWHLIISVGAILLLGSTLVLGTVQHGAKNWIILGPISIQPSEFAKIAYIFVGASTLDVLQTKKSLTEFIIVSAISVGLLVLMSDFGTAVIFFVTFLMIAFMRSGDIKTVALAITAAVLGVVIMLTVKPYIADRFAVWGHVWENADGTGFQQVNALMDTASGGLFGVGISKGYLQHIFASENDLVFCMMSEEIGLIIALTVAVVIGGLMLYARGVTTRSRSTFYSIAACSAAGLLVFQSALNIFGVTDILPLTGVTLPFVSYGGSSMAACWGLLAFIKAADERTYVHRHKKTKKQKQVKIDEEGDTVLVQ